MIIENLLACPHSLTDWPGEEKYIVSTAYLLTRSNKARSQIDLTYTCRHRHCDTLASQADPINPKNAIFLINQLVWSVWRRESALLSPSSLFPVTLPLSIAIMAGASCWIKTGEDLSLSGKRAVYKEIKFGCHSAFVSCLQKQHPIFAPTRGLPSQSKMNCNWPKGCHFARHRRRKVTITKTTLSNIKLDSHLLIAWTLGVRQQIRCI